MNVKNLKAIILISFLAILVSGCSIQFFPDSFLSWGGVILIGGFIIGLIGFAEGLSNDDDEALWAAFLVPFFAWLLMQVLWWVDDVIDTSSKYIGEVVEDSSTFINSQILSFGKYSQYTSKVEMAEDVPHLIRRQVNEAERKALNIIKELQELDEKEEKLNKIRSDLPYSSEKAHKRVSLMLTIINSNQLKLESALGNLRDQIDTVKVQVIIEVEHAQPQVDKLINVLNQSDNILLQVKKELELKATSEY